jgi:hypothetical protein
MRPVVFLDDIEANVVAAREVGMHAVLFQHTTPGNHRGRCVPFGCGWLSLTADGATGYTEGLSDDDHSFTLLARSPNSPTKPPLARLTPAT